MWKKDFVLITRRRPEGLLGGLWEFPGGKVKKNETASGACVREIAEETGLKIRVDSHLTRIKHAYTHFKIDMDVFIYKHLTGRVRLNGPDYVGCFLEPRTKMEYPGPAVKKRSGSAQADCPGRGGGTIKDILTIPPR